MKSATDIGDLAYFQYDYDRRVYDAIKCTLLQRGVPQDQFDAYPYLGPDYERNLPIVEPLSTEARTIYFSTRGSPLVTALEAIELLIRDNVLDREAAILHVFNGAFRAYSFAEFNYGPRRDPQMPDSPYSDMLQSLFDYGEIESAARLKIRKSAPTRKAQSNAVASSQDYASRLANID